MKTEVYKVIDALLERQEYNLGNLMKQAITVEDFSAIVDILATIGETRISANNVCSLMDTEDEFGECSEYFNSMAMKSIQKSVDMLRNKCIG